MPFARSISGKVVEFLFYNVPLVWVEGNEDISMYFKLIKSWSCKIKEAGGKAECKKLLDELVKNDYPYIVILDGDYEILTRKRSYHRRAILLQRYSIENYLFEKRPIEYVCGNYANWTENVSIMNNFFESFLTHLEKRLFDVVVLDIANERAKTGYPILPKSIESLLNGRKSHYISKDRVKAIIGKYKNYINKGDIRNSQKLLNGYLKCNRFVDILKGHLVIGLIRRFISFVVLKRAREKVSIRKKDLQIILANEVWTKPSTNQHKNLRRKLGRAISEVNKLQGFL